MNPLDIMLTALSSLASNKLRAGLTLLGMVIGVSAVIFLMSLGRGAQAAITSNITSLGTNLLTITPGSEESGGFGAFMLFGRGGSDDVTLTIDDAYALVDPAFTPSVVAVAPQNSTFGSLDFGSKNWGAQMQGVTPEFEQVRNVEMKYGSFISHGHVRNNTSVAVLGSSVSEALFGFRDPVGQSVKVNGKPFTVIGVTESQEGGFFGGFNELVFAPLTTLHYRMSSNRTSQGDIRVDTIYVQVAELEQMESAIGEISTVLRLRHRITEEDDFTVTSQQQAIEAVEEATNAFVIFLGSIAGISLLVGGIGIMNIMLVSVTERTREIGIRKAMGAKRRDVLFQFVVESSLLSCSGGLIGLAIGTGLSFLLDGREIFGPGQEFNAVISGDMALLAVTVSAGIGLFFGIYPAVRAARMHPIDALRYE